MFCGRGTCAVECVVIAESPKQSVWPGKLGFGNTPSRSTAKLKLVNKKNWKWIGTHGKLRLGKTAIQRSCAKKTAAAGVHLIDSKMLNAAL